MARNANNKGLSAAAKAKKDEFYTQLSDIEKELKSYRKHFKDKVVLCNCDDPFESNFFKYFVLNFNQLGLKKLIATCYTGSPIAGTQLSIFSIIGDSETTHNKPYKAIVTQVYDKTGDGGVDMFDVAELFKSGENTLELLEGNGDFRSPECLALMDESDIVVTNPPFSLFREYVATLLEHGKKFLVIGNINAITYKEIFPLIKDNHIWLGTGMGRWISGFIVPQSYELYGTEASINEKGERIVATNNCLWLTNMDHKKRHEDIICYKKYTPEEYPHYDNYDAIEVSMTTDIPVNYKGAMGVPITFLDKHNPEQFEIIGSSLELAEPESKYATKGTYQQGGPSFYITESINPEKHKRIYNRIVIRYSDKWIATHPDDFKGE